MRGKSWVEIGPEALSANVGFGTLSGTIDVPDGVRTMVTLFDIQADGSLSGNPTFVPCGKQPDALTFTPDGSKVLVANEGEPREGYGEGVIDPEGSVTMVDVASATGTKIGFAGVKYDGNVLLKNGSTPKMDFEPEYIACDNQTAYVALQENNAIAVLDIATGTFTGVYGLGLKDFSKTPVDLQKNDKVEIVTHDNVYGLYMPDGISMATINGTTYLFTANEGDGREWGEEDAPNFYCNEQKGKTSPTGDVSFENKVTWFNPADYAMLDQSRAYLYGGRSFSIWAVGENGLTQTFDSGSAFEEITSKLMGEHFNCSNDDISFEDRSGKKGCEPEYACVGTVDGKTYAFIGLERLGGIMMYDVSDPANATFVNYLNSRDYSADIAGDVAPEGLYFVDAAHSATGKGLLLAANEVSGTLTVMEMTGAGTGQAAGKQYTVKAGDSLWSISKAFYGVGTQWGKLYQANAGVLSSAQKIFPGQVITIPGA